jgi:regulator of sigma E protease
MEELTKAGQLILSLSILVGLHELGHLLVARAFGMRVEQYFIGFPPKVFSIKRGDTEYGLGAIPLGGFVKISGMIDESLDTSQMDGPPKPYEFRAKPAWQRLIVMLGGIIVNIIVGIIIFVSLTYKNGNNYLAAKDVKYGIVAGKLAQEIGLKTGDKIVVVNGKPLSNFDDVRSPDVFLNQNSSYTVERAGKRIEIDIPNNFANKVFDKANAGEFVSPIQPFSVLEVSPPVPPNLIARLMAAITGKTPTPAPAPAYTAGLKANDRIVSINGKPIRFYHELQQLATANTGKPIMMGVQRGQQSLTLNLTITPEGKIGFAVKQGLPVTHEDYTFGQALTVGTSQAFGVIGNNIKGFGKIFRRQMSASNSLSGPIGIAQMFGGVWDWDRFWGISGLLSMALAFMNALPIPALDGGHSVILGYEIISGRKPSDRFLEAAQRVGMVMLLSLMAFAIFNDVFKAFM